MTTTVDDAYLATNLAVPNIRARLSPRINRDENRLTTDDHVVRLSSLHPDERLGYLENIGFASEELAVVSKLVEEWLSPPRRKSLDEASRDACQAEKGLDAIMESWGKTQSFEDLVQLINHSHISQPDPALCYAICAATELAWSMLITHEFDSDRKPVAGGPDAMWAAQDQEIATLDLIEDVERWPK